MFLQYLDKVSKIVQKNKLFPNILLKPKHLSLNKFHSCDGLYYYSSYSRKASDKAMIKTENIKYYQNQESINCEQCTPKEKNIACRHCIKKNIMKYLNTRISSGASFNAHKSYANRINANI